MGDCRRLYDNVFLFLTEGQLIHHLGVKESLEKWKTNGWWVNQRVVLDIIDSITISLFLRPPCSFLVTGGSLA